MSQTFVVRLSHCTASGPLIVARNFKDRVEAQRFYGATVRVYEAKANVKGLTYHIRFYEQDKPGLKDSKVIAELAELVIRPHQAVR